MEFMNQLSELLDKLNPETRNQILAVIDVYLPRIVAIDKLPGWGKGILVPIIANAFLHQIIDVLNDSEYDNKVSRTVALNWTRRLFGLTDWEPAWLYLPFQQPPPPPVK